MTSPIFIIRRGDRLSARLKSILHAWRFARRVGGKTIVGWLPRERSMYNTLPDEPYSPTLVWDLLKFYAEGGSDELFFMEGNNRAAPPYPTLAGPEFDAVRPSQFRVEDFIGKPLVFSENANMMYRFADETEADVTVGIRALYRRLPVEPAITRMIDDAKAAIGGSYVALHVRRGDIPVLLRNASEELLKGHISDVVAKYVNAAVGYTAPLHFYEDAVRSAIQTGRRVIFFSDTPETIGHFREKFGKSIVDGTKLARHARYPIQGAFIDFNLIMQADRVIGTGSSFAVFAAQLGGGQHHSVARQGAVAEFESYFFGEIFAGIDLPSSVRVQLKQIIEGRFGKDRKHLQVEFS